MRKIVSIQRISQLSPIENADTLECATILGWTVVVKKGSFAENDLCVYFEIDAFLPMDDPRYEFMHTKSYAKNELVGEGLRVKTMKLRGQLSQGLAMPISDFPELIDCAEGDDVTTILRVKKYEIPEMETDAGTIISKYPVNVPKTDETRIQNAPDLIDEFANLGCDYYISTKIDGTSCTFMQTDGQFKVCGHNNEYKRDAKTCPMWDYAIKRGIEDSMLSDSRAQDIAIQGEFAGPEICKNPLGLKTLEFFAFTAYDIRAGKRLPLQDMLALCNHLGIQTVPIEEIGSTFPYKTLDDLLQRAEGTYHLSGKPKEGIVIRPVEPVHSPTLRSSLSMKVINNRFLLKEK